MDFFLSLPHVDAYVSRVSLQRQPSNKKSEEEHAEVFFHIVFVYNTNILQKTWRKTMRKYRPRLPNGPWAEEPSDGSRNKITKCIDIFLLNLL